MYSLTIAIAVAGSNIVSGAQISVSPKPESRAPSFMQHSCAMPKKLKDGKPQRAMAVSWDGKSSITSIDGKTLGIKYSLGSEHVICGVNLSGFAVGRITSNRMPDLLRGRPVGSMLTLVSETPTKLVVRVTHVSSGAIPWSASNSHYQSPPRLFILIAGGARSIEVIHDVSTRYLCSADEPNCSQ